MAKRHGGTRCRVACWWLSMVLALVGSGVAHGQETVAISGQFVVYWVDDFADGGSRAAYRLRDTEDARSYELVFDTPPAGLRSGDHVVVHGVETSPGVLRVQRYERPTDLSAGKRFAAQAAAAPPSGEQRTAVLLLDFRDATQSCTTSQIEERLFSAPDSVSQGYVETSSGRVSFAGKAFGPFLIDDHRSQQCNPFGWAEEANRLATAAGVDLRAYPRRLYLIATNPGWTCGWGGISELGVTPSASVVEAYGGCGYEYIHMHELGHALGMHHANADPDDSGGPGEEYGDLSDFMGNGNRFRGHTNAPHKLQMGWISSEAAPLVRQNGRFPLRPLETPLDSPWWPSMLRIARPGSDASYFVSFRRRIGIDFELDDLFSERTSIHRWGEEEFGGRTALVRTLGDHETFAGSGFVVSQLDRSAGGAFVEVAFSCEHFAPVVAAPSVRPDGRARLRADVSVRNDDTALCPPSDFSFSATGPSGWSIAATPAALSVAPKALGTATLQIEMPVDTAPGTYELVVSVAGSDGAQHAQLAIPVDIRPGGGGGDNGGGGDTGCADDATAPLDRARCLAARLLADGPCTADALRPPVERKLRVRAQLLDSVLGKIVQAKPRRARILAARAVRIANSLSRFLVSQGNKGKVPAACAATTGRPPSTSCGGQGRVSAGAPGAPPPPPCRTGRARRRATAR